MSRRQSSATSASAATPWPGRSCWRSRRAMPTATCARQRFVKSRSERRDRGARTEFIPVLCDLCGLCVRAPTAVLACAAMARVTGIGGVFFKARDADALRAWYRTHLGLDILPWGGVAFKWREGETGGREGATIWN